MNYTNELTNFDQRVQQANEGLQMGKTRRSRHEVPLWQKDLLSLEEAAALTGLGMHRLRAIGDDEHTDIVLWAGNKRLFKRKKLEAYLEQAYSV